MGRGFDEQKRRELLGPDGMKRKWLAAVDNETLLSCWAMGRSWKGSACQRLPRYTVKRRIPSRAKLSEWQDCG